MAGSIPGARKSLFLDMLGGCFCGFLHMLGHVGGHFFGGVGALFGRVGVTFWSGRGHFFVKFGMSWDVSGSGLGTFLDRFGKDLETKCR